MTRGGVIERRVAPSGYSPSMRALLLLLPLLLFAALLCLIFEVMLARHIGRGRARE